MRIANEARTPPDRGTKIFLLAWLGAAVAAASLVFLAGIGGEPTVPLYLFYQGALVASAGLLYFGLRDGQVLLWLVGGAGTIGMVFWVVFYIGYCPAG